MFAADSVLWWLLSHLSWVTKVGALALAAGVVVLLSAWWLRAGRRLGARLMLLGFGLTLLGAWVPSQTAGSRASEPAVASGDVTSSAFGTIGSVSPGEAPDTPDGIPVSVRASAQGGWDVEVPAIVGATSYIIRLDGAQPQVFQEAGTLHVDEAPLLENQYLPGPVHVLRVAVLREDGARIVDTRRFCSPVVLLGARGTDENLPDGNFRHGTGDAVRNTWRLLAQQAGVLPEDESVNPTVIGATATAYPATISGYMASVAQGVSDLAQMMADVRRHCPRSRLVLVGFSQGADVVNTTWATLPIGARLVIGVIGYADPRFDRDWITQGIARPEGVDFPYEGPGLGRGPLPSVPRAVTQQWCYPSDPVCQSSQPLAIIDWSHWHGPAYEGYEQWAAYALAPAVIEVLGHHGYPTVVPTEPQTPPTTS